MNPLKTRSPAWHNLGTIIENYPTSAEALIYAGLDYIVEKRPLLTFDNENYEVFSAAKPGSKGHTLQAEISVPDYFSTIRADTQQVLEVVGRDYRVVQNLDAFSFFDSIVGSTKRIRYETAGTLGKGEKIFIIAKLPEYIRIGRDDLLEKYIFSIPPMTVLAV